MPQERIRLSLQNFLLASVLKQDEALYISKTAAPPAPLCTADCKHRGGQAKLNEGFSLVVFFSQLDKIKTETDTLFTDSHRVQCFIHLDQRFSNNGLGFCSQDFRGKVISFICSFICSFLPSFIIYWAHPLARIWSNRGNCNMFPTWGESQGLRRARRMGTKLKRRVEKYDLRLRGLTEPSRKGCASRACRAWGIPNDSPGLQYGEHATVRPLWRDRSHQKGPGPSSRCISVLFSLSWQQPLKVSCALCQVRGPSWLCTPPLSAGPGMPLVCPSQSMP